MAGSKINKACIAVDDINAIRGNFAKLWDWEIVIRDLTDLVAHYQKTLNAKLIDWHTLYYI